ncbi:hypothetical protein [Chitinophaga sp. Ak27]|uniref:hypothetical protein n=1 Tax=Chitinophaga sp. Ak27 TaxID=2726116 RepID=UPI00145CCAE1|nr:hypothetical protein [Chitinophaga sp. Ak27]NLU90940.1 hypothetical protein [Chitinophaga sp. Ak27]
MKRIVLALSCVCFLGVSGVKAQSILDKAKQATGAVQSPALPDAGSILSQLTPALGLTNTQQPKVQSLLTTFLKKKAAILPLQQTNPSAYTSKFGGLKSGLFSKLKTLLTISQYTKLLGLKPKTNDVTNVLSQLFF